MNLTQETQHNKKSEKAKKANSDVMATICDASFNFLVSTRFRALWEKIVKKKLTSGNLWATWH